MQPMSTFDPDRPGRVHVNDKTFDWHTGWAIKWRQYARLDQVSGMPYFDGRILDGWEPMGADLRNSLGRLPLKQRGR
jgi:hypothetical protein